ncbi:thiamine biosynthesis protein ThiF [Euryarchaeota archaeon ex4484_178]|nr:MAG: thiamine biosynthesis protein ThiF [Euryarchaeota archaeon ex4484_178]
MDERYSRQKNLVSQEKLKKANVLIVGVGGLGGFSSLNLALAGIGTLILLDHDVVERSNLNRQVLYRESDIGKKKVYIAAERLKDINPYVEIIPIEGRIGEVNIPQRVDVVIDGLDNMEARFKAEDFALSHGVPYIFGAVEGFMGMVTFIDKGTKRLEDFIHKFPEQIPQVLAPTAAFTASIQALEAIKYLTGKGDLLRNRLLIYDALSTNFLEVRL